MDVAILRKVQAVDWLQ